MELELAEIVQALAVQETEPLPPETHAEEFSILGLTATKVMDKIRAVAEGLTLNAAVSVARRVVISGHADVVIEKRVIPLPDKHKVRVEVTVSHGGGE